MKFPIHILSHPGEIKDSQLNSRFCLEEKLKHTHLNTIIAPRPNMHDYIEESQVEDIPAFNVGRDTVELMKHEHEKSKRNTIVTDTTTSNRSNVFDSFVNVEKINTNQSNVEPIDIMSDGEFTNDLPSPSFQHNRSQSELRYIDKKIRKPHVKSRSEGGISKREMFGFILPQNTISPTTPKRKPPSSSSEYVTPNQSLFEHDNYHDKPFSLFTPSTSTGKGPSSKNSLDFSTLPNPFSLGTTAHQQHEILNDPISLNSEKHSSLDEELISFIVSKNKSLSQQMWLHPELQNEVSPKDATKNKGKRITNIEDTIDDDEEENENENEEIRKDEKLLLLPSRPFNLQDKYNSFMQPNKKKLLLREFFNKNNYSKANHSTTTLSTKPKISLVSLESTVSLKLDPNSSAIASNLSQSTLEVKRNSIGDQNVPINHSMNTSKQRNSTTTRATSTHNSNNNNNNNNDPNGKVVPMASSSSSAKTVNSNDTMIEMIGRPETLDTNYNSSHEFVPTRAPPPPKNNGNNRQDDTEENASSSQSSKISRQEKFQEFSKKIFKKSATTSLEPKSLYGKLMGKEKKRNKENVATVDKNIQTDDINNALNVELSDVKKKQQIKYKEEVKVSLQSFLAANSSSSVVDSFKDYVERSLI
ncbi:hypothetical protein G210_5397 [Candida maltosa Xu316]|uniref:Uncharacterized protein n=1 Tax=Candida maltosa (strain Xu316) TaxID=1245528 RepID=M3K4S9_CANMX|nr:hypothetical protein G210_5397 [Candida maltosa Xu316]